MIGVSILVGLLTGIAVGIPTSVLLFLVWQRQAAREYRQVIEWYAQRWPTGPSSASRLPRERSEDTRLAPPFDNLSGVW